MGCNNEYQRADGRESSMSKVACLLDELDGKEWSLSHFSGYHPDVYGMGKDDDRDDKMVEKLCSKCQKVDVMKYSLELQIWWRDHQEADQKRIKAEIKAKRAGKARKKAIAKLTKYERELLGVDD